MPITEAQLIHSLNQRRRNGRPYAFVLGAGASTSSGIPSTYELATKWLEELRTLNAPQHQALLQDPQYRSDLPNEAYSMIYRQRFSAFPQEARSAIESIINHGGAEPSPGYSILAQVLNNTQHKTLLTPNFDLLPEAALLYYQAVHPAVVTHPETMLPLLYSSQTPVIVRLPHDMLTLPHPSGASPWQPVIERVLDRHDVIVLGYAGNDGHLLPMLETALANIGHSSLYWCHLGAHPPTRIQTLQQKMPHQIELVPIVGFDEFMLNLNKALAMAPPIEIYKAKTEKRLARYEEQFRQLKHTAAATTTGIEASAEPGITWGEMEIRIQAAPNPEQQEQLYQEALQLFPRNDLLMAHYATFLCHVRKDHDQAEQYYLRALVTQPSHVLHNIVYAEFLRDIRHDNDRAEQYFHRALASDPNHVDANAEYASFLEHKLQDHNRAEKFYLRALAIDPEHPVHNSHYAEFLISVRKDYQRAERYYQRALRATPENGSSTEANVNYALFLTNILKDYDRAEECYKQALAQNPDDAAAHGNYATFLKNARQDYSAAEQHFQAALQVGHNHPNINGNYAVFLNQIRKDYGKAEKYYLRSLAADPNHATNNANYAGFLLARGQIQQAEPYLARAEKQATSDALRLELAFYRLAHFPDTAKTCRATIARLLEQGVRSPGWDFSSNIARAKQAGCKWVPELQTLAQQISALDPS